MNRNKIDEITIISNILAKEKNADKISVFFSEILTNSELKLLSKRWRILEMLEEGRTQRDISKELKVSLCKVTRGSQILKNKKSVTANYLKKETKNEYK